MSVHEREYMGTPKPDPIGEPDALGVEIPTKGTRYQQQQQAEKVLKFACPTQDANGKWYRCTLAVTCVPVGELYNVISNVDLIGKRIHEIVSAQGTSEHDVLEIDREQLEQLSASLQRIAGLLRQRNECGPAGPELLDPTIHIHKA